MPQYEITSPDGTKYRVTAPEGASQQDVMAYVQSQHAGPHKPKNFDATPEGLKPSSPENYKDQDMENYFDVPSLSFKQRPGNFAAALGGGAERFVRGAGNLVVSGLNKILPSDPTLSDLITGDKRAIKGGFFSDEAIRAQDQLDKPLKEQNELGYGVGEALPTLPVGEGVTALSNTVRGVRYLGPVLRNALTRAGVEGAVDAAAVGDVDKQGEAAAEGAIVNSGLGLALKGAGRFVNGVVQKSRATQDLEHLAGQQGRDLFVPLSQAGDEAGDLPSRLVQSVYREGLPLVPGVQGQMQRQARNATATIRDMALAEADPTGTIIRAGSGEEGLQARRALKDAFDKEYQNTVGSYTFNVPSDLRQQIAARVRARMPNVDNTTLTNVQDAIEQELTRYSNGQNVIDGTNLMNAKTGANSLYGQMRGPEKSALNEGLGVIDDIVERDLQQGGNAQNLADLDRYQHLAEPYSAFKQVGAAIEKAKANRGQFTPAQLARSSRDPGTLLHLGTTANEVLGRPVSAPSTAGRVAAYSLGALGGYHNPAMLAGAVGGANLLATQTAQRVLMGDTSAQRAISELVKRHPEMAHRISTVIRGAAATQAGDSNVNP